MCGIAGQVCLKHNFNTRTEDFYKIQETLSKRGPDQNGLYLTEDVALIHSRLCVIDIENGRQPMCYTKNENKFTIIYNGELYNTNEIRASLIKDGFDFIGHSDTEVILKAYVKWGANCVHYFNGIFAFAVWDEKLKKLFFARDRIGVKPFFFTVKENKFIFGSELKAILAHPEIKPQIDINSIAEIMLIGPGRSPGYGVFKGIEELPPACCGYYGEDGLDIYRYWSLEDKEHTDSLEQTIEKVRFLVTDSIERQLVSDVPVCTFLSGGLDSSIITSVASRHFKKQGKKLHTYSVDYRDNDKNFTASKFQPNSDSDFIGTMVDYADVESHIVMLDTPELVNALYAAVKARDLPGMADVDSSLLLFCEEIKKQHVVALSGECSDEIFGGYPWYRDETIRMQYGFPWSQSTAYRASFLSDEVKEMINESEYVSKKYESTLKLTSKLAGISPTEGRMKEMMRLNLDWFMQTLLDRKDRMSMYNGLEVRVPFCDYRIAEYLYSVPWEFKDYMGYEKGLLRIAMKDYLPEEILWRKKSPYPKTHNPNYLKAVSDILISIISDSSSPLFKFINRDKLRQLLYDNSQVPWYGQLMTTPQTIAYFIQLDFWLRYYNIEIIL